MIKTCPDNPICHPVKSREDAAFPWMIVELKKDNGDERECLRQAANASHISLMLYEQLAEPTAMKVLPIIAFTSIGPRVKIFIAYIAEEDDEDKVYVSPTLIPGNYCANVSFKQLTSLLASVCLVYGVAISRISYMPSSFDVLLIN